MSEKSILITGAVGFIGSHLVKRLCKEAKSSIIIGVDNMNDYYDVRLKEQRLYELNQRENFIFEKGNIADKAFMENQFKKYRPQIVVNLAAQAGVRYSIENPETYIESNIIGFMNILEACRKYPVEHLLFASSSSVYGANKKYPYKTEDKTDQPVSLYAATKKSDELLGYAYAKLYGIAMTGLRFFTVYGPAGRPDMAYFHFANKLRKGEEIRLFNYGKCKRDFTYIDDIVDGIIKVIEQSPKQDENNVAYKIYNIGNSQPVLLTEFLEILWDELVDANIVLPEDSWKKHCRMLPMQPGDVEITYADISELECDFGFRPKTSLKEGLHNFVKWYKDFYLQLQ